MNRQFQVSNVPVNNVTRTQFIDAIETMQPRAGSVLAALDGLTTAGPVALTSATDGAKTMSSTLATVLALTRTRTVLTGSGVCDLTKDATILNAASGAFTLTLGNGSYDGQLHTVVFIDGASTAEWTASGLTNLLGFTGFVMNAASHSLQARWDSSLSQWAQVGGNCLMS